jgi:hypothetical protein
MFLHFIPARDLANRHHGTYKDVISRVQWLQNRFSDYRQIAVREDDPAEVDAALADGAVLQGALVEYSYFPRMVKRLKQRVPNAVVAVRSINLEPLQHFDNHGWRCKRGPLWLLYGMGRLLAHDLAVKRTADVVLSINQWENRVYWNRLPGRAKVAWLPYRCPDHMLPTQPLPYGRRRVIACLPTSQKNRKSWDLVTRFQKLATAMKQHGSPDEFVLTGNLRDWNLPECPAVEQLGFIEDLAGFTGTCKAVALLSPMGYGFKTTMADALAAGAQVLAHPGLVRSCPDAIRPYLLSVDSEDAVSIGNAQHQLVAVPDGPALHDELTRRAASVMERWFGGVAC